MHLLPLLIGAGRRRPRCCVRRGFLLLLLLPRGGAGLGQRIRDLDHELALALELNGRRRPEPTPAAGRRRRDWRRVGWARRERLLLRVDHGALDLGQIQLLAPLLLQARQAALPRHPLLPGLLARRRLRPGHALRACAESGRRWHRVRCTAGERRVLLRPGHVRRLHVSRLRRWGERLAAHDNAARAAARLERVDRLAAVSLLVGHRPGGGGAARLRGEFVAGVGAWAGELVHGSVDAGPLLLQVVVLHPGEDELEQLHGALPPAAEPRGRGLDGGASEADAAEVLGRDASHSMKNRGRSSAGDEESCPPPPPPAAASDAAFPAVPWAVAGGWSEMASSIIMPTSSGKSGSSSHGMESESVAKSRSSSMSSSTSSSSAAGTEGSPGAAPSDAPRPRPPPAAAKVLEELDEEEEEKVELDGEERQGKSGRDGKVSSANMKSSPAAAAAASRFRISPAGAFPRPPPCLGGFSCERAGEEAAEASMQRDALREGDERRERGGCVCAVRPKRLCLCV